jgi:hypothetical protein
MKQRIGFHVLAVLCAFIVLTVVPTGARAGERWQWSIAPYLWASDIGEDLTLKGRDVGGSDTEFKDIVDKLDSSLQLHFEGIEDRWGLFADLVYIDLSDSTSLGGGLLPAEIGIEESVLETGAIYRPGGRPGRLDVLFGLRVLSIDEDYRLDLGRPGVFTTRIDERYVDALAAARYNIPLGDRWSISLRGDLSGGGTDYMWTGQALASWRFGARRGSGIYLGYRYRETSYSKSGLEVEKTFSGPALGIQFGF